MIRPRFRPALHRAIEDGITIGVLRALKYDATPGEDDFVNHVLNAVINEIDEWFEDVGEDDARREA